MTTWHTMALIVTYLQALSDASSTLGICPLTNVATPYVVQTTSLILSSSMGHSPAQEHAT